MKTIEEASKEHEQQFGFNSDGKINSSPAESFKEGVELAQRWISIEDESPQYYQTVLADNGKYMAVVAKVSDGDEDFFPICGTNVYMSPDPIKWRQIELK